MQIECIIMHKHKETPVLMISMYVGGQYTILFVILVLIIIVFTMHPCVKTCLLDPVVTQIYLIP